MSCIKWGRGGGGDIKQNGLQGVSDTKIILRTIIVVQVVVDTDQPKIYAKNKGGFK